MKSRVFLLVAILALAGCANRPPQTQSGHKPKLETIQHDYATTYLYR